MHSIALSASRDQLKTSSEMQRDFLLVCILYSLEQVGVGLRGTLFKINFNNAVLKDKTSQVSNSAVTWSDVLTISSLIPLDAAVCI